MREDFPFAEEATTSAAVQLQPVAEPPREPEKRSPEVWASKSGRLRSSKTDISMAASIGGMPIKESPFKGDHRAAARKHRWADAQGFLLTRADYEAAIVAAKNNETHGPAVPEGV